MFVWALPASLVLHLLIAALLMFDLPLSFPQPQEEQAIKVELVPPPKPPEKAKVELPPPAKPEPPPSAKAEPPPPPKAPEPEKPQAAKVEPPPAIKDTAPPEPLPALRPVVQFGEKDAGPREDPKGDSAEDGSSSPKEEREPDEKVLAEPPTMTAAGAAIQVSPPGKPETKAPRAAEAVKVQEAPKLQKAKKLFSRTATGDPLATTAMGDLPRGARAAQLCVSELRAQLLHASPPYLPEFLPSQTLKDGTVIDVRRAAFRGSGQWYDISYRCEVDTEATKVVSFSFGVGDLVPRSEWRQRGLPSL